MYEIKKSMGHFDPLIFGDPLLVFANRQKEGLSHQLHSESESVGEGISLGDAMHFVHAFLELFECFLLLVRECFSQLIAIPGYQLK